MAPTPDAVRVPEGLAEALARASTFLGGALAVVSGRMLGNVDDYLDPLVLPGSGNHGIERRRADGRVIVPDQSVRETAAAIMNSVRQRLGRHPGLIFEGKVWSASLHYRGAPERAADCIAAMRAAVAQHPGWEVIEGKMVVEGRLASVSKASAVEAFMAEPPFAGRRPVFMGDDATDEDGMRAATALGGYGIKVGDGETVARYRLGRPKDVLVYLEGVGP
jgi:trehalose 6-phosphate phosphatase